MSCLIALLRYRMLHECRQAVRGTSRVKLKLLLMVLGPAIGLFMVGGYFAFLLKSAGPLLSAGDLSLRRVLEVSLLAAGAMTFLIILSDTLREVWFASDSEMLAIAPISLHVSVAYRSLFAVLREAPWVALFLILPVMTVSAFPQARLATELLIVFLVVLYWAWLAAAALCVASLILAASNRWRLGRHGLYVALYLLDIAIMLYVLSALQTPTGWLEGAGKFNPSGWFALLPLRQIAAVTVQVHSKGFLMPLLQVAALIATLGCPPFLFYFAAVRLWPWAERPASATSRAGGAFSSRRLSPLFSTNRSWAIFQKDLKDLVRNPAYRSSLIATLLLLIIGLWTQARQPASSKQLRMTLALIYMPPLLVSARAASLEYRLLELYKLVLPCRYNLLDAKLRTQAVINVIATIVAALPLILLLKPGFETFTVLYFVGAAILFVPVMTALALALGTYFPDLSSGPSMLGVKAKGYLAYLLLGACLYSFLLNRMYLGTGVYFVFLTAITAALYLGARKRLYSLIGRRSI